MHRDRWCVVAITTSLIETGATLPTCMVKHWRCPPSETQ
jgi:hypothetical protein